MCSTRCLPRDGPWALFRAGSARCAPCGSRKRYPLYGLDLDETTTPIEAGLGWTVKLTKPAFDGREVLAGQKQNGTVRQLVLLLLAMDATLPSVGAAVRHGAADVGRVTSSNRGYTLGRTPAMAYVPPVFAVDGQTLSIAGLESEAVVSTRPAYDPDGLRARS